jgi:predicted DCC family thiol-disulfide oxidoreductase YuxK
VSVSLGSGASVVFYDGACGFCRGSVRRIAAADAAGRFRFAPLAGETWRAAELGAPPPDTIVLLDAAGRSSVRSDAVAAILIGLGGRHAVLGRVLRATPRFLRDAGYRLVARFRRRLPGDSAACPLPPAAWRDRFLP